MSTNNNKNKGTGLFWFLSFVLLSVFYIGIACIDGPQWCVDSPSYDSMSFIREPVYPLFLNGLKALCSVLGITAEPYGLPAYLSAAVFLQSILWVVSALYLGFYIHDVFSEGGSGKRGKVLAAVAMLLQVAVSSLNRFVANRGSMYSETIMTESLAMPLFVIFTVLLLKSLDDYDILACIKLFWLSVLLASIRKQMLIAMILWGFTSFVFHLFVKKYRSLKKFSYTVIAVALGMVMIALLDRSYNMVVRGVFASHVGNSKGALDTVLYTAKSEDAELFKEYESEEFPHISELYTKIYDQCLSQQLTIDFAPGYELLEKSNVFNSDWVSMASHYADSYDVIGFDVVLPICDDYVAENFPELDEVHAQIKENQVEDLLFKVLLKHDIKNITSGNDRGVLYVLSANILKAFVISNANISPRILVKASLVIYIIYILAFILLAVRLAAKGPNKVWEKTLIMCFVVMAGLSINCVITGSMIFPQPRYMCYSMGLFYLTLTCAILSR